MVKLKAYQKYAISATTIRVTDSKGRSTSFPYLISVLGMDGKQTFRHEVEHTIEITEDNLKLVQFIQMIVSICILLFL